MPRIKKTRKLPKDYTVSFERVIEGTLIARRLVKLSAEKGWHLPTAMSVTPTTNGHDVDYVGLHSITQIPSSLKRAVKTGVFPNGITEPENWPSGYYVGHPQVKAMRQAVEELTGSLEWQRRLTRRLLFKWVAVSNKGTRITLNSHLCPTGDLRMAYQEQSPIAFLSCSPNGKTK